MGESIDPILPCSLKLQNLIQTDATDFEYSFAQSAVISSKKIVMEMKFDAELNNNNIARKWNQHD